NTILGILLTWTIFGTLYETQCTDIPLEFNMEVQTNGCKDHHGEIHELNIYWFTDDCEMCHCSPEGMECSSAISMPIGYDKEKCKVVFNAEECIYKAVEKDNPSQSCKVSKYVV
uniref:Beta-microseminoprotein n=1 Tax=Monodelphis domestica TaxID=13616 RepID=A0A5F8GQR9_MONDO